MEVAEPTSESVFALHEQQPLYGTREKSVLRVGAKREDYAISRSIVDRISLRACPLTFSLRMRRQIRFSVGIICCPYMDPSCLQGLAD